MNAVKPLKALLDLAIKNSQIIQPLIAPKDYAKGLLLLNGAYMALCLLDQDARTGEIAPQAPMPYPQAAHPHAAAFAPHAPAFAPQGWTFSPTIPTP